MAGAARGVGESPYSQEQWSHLQATAPERPPRTYAERRNYPSFAGILIATLLIPIPIVGWVALFVDLWMILRYIFGYRSPGSPTWSIHHPSVKSLVVVWVIAPFTGVGYPFAIYMTYRSIVEYRQRRLAANRTCPRCAETIKAAALVCRYCGVGLPPLAPATPPVVVTASEPHVARPPASPVQVQQDSPVAITPPAAPEPPSAVSRSRHDGAIIVATIGILAAILIVAIPALVMLGSQVSTKAPLQTARALATAAPAAPAAAVPAATSAANWPPSGFTLAGLSWPVAYKWLEVDQYSCLPGQANGCMGIDIRWLGTCESVSVEMDTSDAKGVSTGVATGSGRFTGNAARLIVAMPSSTTTQVGTWPRITCD